MGTTLEAVVAEYEALESDHTALCDSIQSLLAGAHRICLAALSVAERSRGADSSGEDSPLPSIRSIASGISESCSRLRALPSAAEIGEKADLFASAITLLGERCISEASQCSAVRHDCAALEERRYYLESQLKEAKALADALTAAKTAAIVASPSSPEPMKTTSPTRSGPVAALVSAHGSGPAASAAGALAQAAASATALALPPASSARIEALTLAIDAESAGQRERLALAEARASQLERQLAHAAAAHAAEIGELRARLAEAEAARGALAPALDSLRAEAEAQHARAAAQDALVASLRDDLASSQARLARLQLHKSEVANSAAAAMRDMEAQVAALTAALVAAQQQQQASRAAGLTARRRASVSAEGAPA